MKTSQSESFPHLHLETVDSTNSEALRLAAAGERGPLWITADRQTAGRGRAGRSWTAPAGNLATTLLFAPGCRPAVLHEVAFVAGVAVHDAIDRAIGGNSALTLKWPNDILIDGAKAGGILTETTMFGGATIAAIGIGLNVAAAPQIDGRRIARLADHAQALTRENLLGHLDHSFRHWLPIWSGGAGFATVRESWLTRAGALGSRLSVNAGSDLIEGDYHGIDEGGALLLRTADGTLKRLTYGDVSLIGSVPVPSERTT